MTERLTIEEATTLALHRTEDAVTEVPHEVDEEGSAPGDAEPEEDE